MSPTNAVASTKVMVPLIGRKLLRRAPCKILLVFLYIYPQVHISVLHIGQNFVDFWHIVAYATAFTTKRCDVYLLNCICVMWHFDFLFKFLLLSLLKVGVVKASRSWKVRTSATRKKKEQCLLFSILTYHKINTWCLMSSHVHMYVNITWILLDLKWS